MNTTQVRRSSLAVVIATLLLACGLAFASVQTAQADELAAATLTAQDVSKNYTMGKTVKGKVVADNDRYYAFTVSSAAGADVSLWVKNLGSIEDCYLYAKLESSSGSTVWSERIDDNQKAQLRSQYLPKGSYKLHLYCTGYHFYYPEGSFYMSTAPNECKYQFKIATVKHKVKLGSTSGKPKIGNTKEVSFTFNGSDEYAQKNLKIVKNSQPKVASAEIELGENGVGTLKVTPKRMGTTNIFLKIGSGNKVKYTAYVTAADDYVAQGSTVTLTKPIGVKKLTFSNKTAKSKKVATVNKKGVATGKKQGRAAIVAKKGKVKYSYNVVVTNYMKLAREAYELIDEYAPDPDLVTINYAYQGLCKKIYTGFKVPAVYLDISFTNESGGRTRNKFVAWYDDALDLQTSTALTKNTLMKKKSMNKKKIKNY